MKIYMAGIYTANFHHGSRAYHQLAEVERKAIDNVDHHLESYFYINSERTLEKIRHNGTKIFLDSGAFSAFTKGAEIDVAEYCSFIRKNSDLILNDEGVFMAASLDVVGDALATWKNQRKLESYGLTPIPTYHLGEDLRYLEHYSSNYPYIAIGGCAQKNGKELTSWLDLIWSKYLCDADGRAKVKVHGFALTRESIMRRYPWYSVDSATWVRAAFSGSIVTPEGFVVSVSARSPSTKIPNQNYNNFCPAYRDAVEKIIEREGFDVDRLVNNTYSRWAFNLHILTKLNASINQTETRFVLKQKGLFDALVS